MPRSKFARPWWHRPFIKFLNWWELGHTEASFGEHYTPGYGPPRCPRCGQPIDGHYHEEDLKR